MYRMKPSEAAVFDKVLRKRHLHMFDTRLCCDGREHYYPCVVKGCNERQYFSKHLANDRHCPRAPDRVDEVQR